MPTLNDAHATIGCVVSNGQFFEVVFVLCAKLVYAQKDAQTVAEIAPLGPKTFKAPTTALLRELRDHVKVSEKFEELITDVVDRRHTLIHRWLLEKGWPQDDGESAAIAELTEFSRALNEDLIALTRILVKAVHDWLRKFPEMSGGLKALSHDWLSRLPAAFQGVAIED